MTARLAWPAAALILALAGVAVAQEATEQAAPAAEPAAPPPPVEKAAPAVAPAPAKAAATAPAATPATPTARKPVAPAPAPAPGERVAVIAALDKRLGTTQDFTLKPGERFQFGRLSGVLQSCERTQPFERKQSAAFVQVVEQPVQLQGKPKPPPRTVFSGWLFAESPSLNPFIHPVYDVWLKSCTMRFPDGPKPPPTTRRPARKPASAPAATPAAPAAAPAATPAPEAG